MSVREFLSFRRLALSEALDEDECFEDELLEIYRRGLLCRVPKEGIRIASELLEYYEGFYGTVYEEKFLCEKYLKAALFAAARLYGIFRKEQFTAILKKYAPGEPDKDQVDEFFESEINSYFGIGIRWLKDDYFYYSKDIGEREALGLLKLMDTGRGNFYIPEKEETDLLALKGLSFSQKNKNILNGIIRDNSYYGYYDDIEGDSCDVILRYLHISGDVEGALKVAENRMKRLYWSNDRDMVLDKVRKILREEAVNLPLMIYNGFSGKNCPKEILSHVNDKRQLLEEKEKKKRLLPGRRRS